MNTGVLITGGSGIIGQSLASKLTAKYEVTITSRNPLDERLTSSNYREINAYSQREILDGISKSKTIYLMEHGTFPRQGVSISDTNRNLSHNGWILDQILLSPRSNLEHLVLISSGGTIYGEPSSTEPISESMQTNPASSYGLEKLILENQVTFVGRLIGVPVTIVRVSNAYGTTLSITRPQGVIGVNVGRAKANLPINMIGDRQIVRDYIHVEDLANLLILLTNAPLRSTIYNAGSGIGHTTEEVITQITSHVPNLEIIETPAQISPTWNVLDISKAKKELGWIPKIDLNEGIARMFRE